MSDKTVADKTHETWENMRARCKRSKNPLITEYYQKKSISCCDRWSKYKNFLEDMGYKPDGMWLDRIDNDKGYSKENCRWITVSHSNSNKSRKRENNLPRGVVKNKKGRYVATITFKKVRKHIGTFNTITEAENAFLIVYRSYYNELPPEYRRF